MDKILEQIDMIVGEPGIGKTSCIDKLSEFVRSSETMELHRHCHEEESTPHMIDLSGETAWMYFYYVRQTFLTRFDGD